MLFFLLRCSYTTSLINFLNVFDARCFGGEVSWHSTDAIGATFDESCDSITHQIVDRPVQGHRYLSRCVTVWEIPSVVKIWAAIL